MSNDRIKVEVWDVVDHGRSPDFLPLPSLVDQWYDIGKRKSKPQARSEGLKLTLDDPADDVDDVEEDGEEDAPPRPKASTDAKVELGNHGLDNLKADAETVNVYKDANAVLVRAVDYRGKA